MSHLTLHHLWPTQPHFQRAAEIAARNFFRTLDPRFQPRLFLLGLHVDRPATPLLDAMPDFDPLHFSTLDAIAETFLVGPDSPDRPSGSSSSLPPESSAAQPLTHDRRRFTRARYTALQYLLDTLPQPADAAWVSYTCLPAVVRNHEVYVILQLQYDVKSEYYELTLPRTVHRHSLHLSLVDAAADDFLAECVDLLNAADDQSPLVLDKREKDELLRSAGKHFMQSIASAATNDPSVSLLFDALCNIASLRYEGQEGTGRIVFAPPQHASLDLRVTFKRPIPIADTRAARKVLEISSSSLCLVSDGSHIYGLGDIETNPGEGSAKEGGEGGAQYSDLFHVDFIRHGEWQLLHNHQPVMKVAYNIPSLPQERADAARLRNAIIRVFPEIHPDAIEKFWLAIRTASSQKHGTIIVISENAATEALRLETQATLVNPVELTPALAAQLSTIDGAVLLDQHCRCHAIGVILDGLATQKGDRSRGSRYNSAVRYIESSAHRDLAVVVSEDGTVNVLPELRPQLSKSDIAYRLDVLENIAAAGDLNTTALGQLLRWFENNRFYLLADACERLNAALTTIRTRLESDSENRTFFHTFTPNPAMNESFLIP